MLNNSLEKKVFKSRAPLRISLAGGGTDIKAFFKNHGGAVLNIAITKYAYSQIILKDQGFEAYALDISKNIKIKEFNEGGNQSELPLHFHTYKYMMEKYNNNKYISSEIKTYCDCPIGSGLGSSSTLVIAMVKCWSEVLKLGLDEYSIAEDAYFIERIKCKLDGGLQDHYAAAFGGVNFIEFSKSDIIVHPLKLKKWFQSELESSIVLHFTGKSRESASIIRDQIKLSRFENSDSIKNLHFLKRISYEMKTALLKCSLKDISKLLNQSWEYKKNTSSKISNEEIKDRINFGLSNGAKAAKISGAGGGGFIIYIADSSHAIALRNSLKKKSSETCFISFEENGAHSWVIND